MRNRILEKNLYNKRIRRTYQKICQKEENTQIQRPKKMSGDMPQEMLWNARRMSVIFFARTDVCVRTPTCLKQCQD
jgi:hypothetical protein